VKQTRQVILLLVRLLLSAGAVYFLWKACAEFYNLAWGVGTWLGGFSPKLGPAFFFFILICLFILASFLLALWRPALAQAWLLRLTPLRERLGWARWLLVGLILVVPVKVLQYSYWGGVFTGVSMRLLLLAVMAIAIAALITKGQENTIKLPNVSIALLLISAALYLGDAFHWVSNYPFSFSWSEGNRIWDYSALFGQRLYNFPEDQSIYAFIDRGRQFLWGLPFLLPGITLRGMRLWDGLVTTIPYAILGWVAFQRFKGHTALWFLAGVWAFVFLTQGPIYTPLVMSAILVAIAWRRPLWIALPLIGLAGYYAQLARYTWMFAPAMWAGMLYLADAPTEGQKITKRQWISAALVVLAGLIGGIVIQRLLDTGQQVAAAPGASVIVQETSPESDVISLPGLLHVLTRQPLLWDRLLPNATYPLGILLAVVLVSVPLIILLIYLVRTHRWQLDWLRGLVVAGPLVLFLAVGLVVSVKIGGGSNLHNLDMYLIGLLFAAALAWRAGGFRALAYLDKEPVWVQSLMIVMMLVFAYLPLRGAGPIELPADDTVEHALSGIREQVALAAQEGEVLFMDQRQLLTFGYVPKIPLVDDYEKKLMMDTAMSGDSSYFESLYKDLARHRFSLIVSEPLRTRVRASDYQFGDENNAWVKWVAAPVLCYYKPLVTYKEVKVQLLVPRAGGGDCPDIPGGAP
jgi:hypothetical protein